MIITGSEIAAAGKLDAHVKTGPNASMIYIFVHVLCVRIKSFKSGVRAAWIFPNASDGRK
jgi:hypothetical protein